MNKQNIRLNQKLFIVCWLLLSISFQSCAQSREVKLNSEHRFEFNACEMRYNGQAFKLGDSIDKFIELFGPYSRMVDLAHDTYVWDTLGVSVYVPWDKKNVIEVNIIFDSKRTKTKYPPGKEHDFRRQVQEEMYAAIPRPFFAGGILVGGVAIDNKSTIEEYNAQAREFRIGRGSMNWRYEILLTECEPAYWYVMDVADDGKTIERLVIARHRTDWKKDDEE